MISIYDWVIFIFGNNFTRFDFGDRIAQRRKMCGFKSQAALAACMVPENDNADEYAKAVESKRKAISNWESGKSDPSLADFVLLCGLLNCDEKYLLGEISVPRADMKTVMDIIGVSETSVEKLMSISRHNSETWWCDTLNLIIESEEFVDLLRTITNYIDDNGENAEIVNTKLATTAQKYTVQELLQYQAQSLLFLILHNAKDAFSSREDKRIFYSLVRSWQKSGQLSQSRADECIAKLDNDDFSDFQ